MKQDSPDLKDIEKDYADRLNRTPNPTSLEKATALIRALLYAAEKQSKEN